MRGLSVRRVLALLLAVIGTNLSVFLAFLPPARAAMDHEILGVWKESQIPTPGLVLDYNLGGTSGVTIYKSEYAPLFNEYANVVAPKYWGDGGSLPADFFFTNSDQTDCSAPCYNFWHNKAGLLQSLIQTNWSKLLNGVTTLTADLAKMNTQSKNLGGSYFDRSADGKYTFNNKGLTTVGFTGSFNLVHAQDTISGYTTTLSAAMTTLFMIQVVMSNTKIPGSDNVGWSGSNFYNDFSLGPTPFQNIVNQQLNGAVGGILPTPSAQPDRSHEVIRPSNVGAIVSGGAVEVGFDKVNGYYQSDQDFANDYKLITKLLDPTLWTGKDNTGLTYAQIHSNIDPILNALSKTPTGSGIGNSQSGLDVCGSGSVFQVGLLGLISHAFCAVTVLAYNVTTRMVAEAANLLQLTSDVVPPGSVNTSLSPPPSIIQDQNNTDATSFIFSTNFTSILTNPIEQELVNSDPKSFGPLVQKAYNLVLGLVDAALIFAFILVALANILQISLNNYAIKKIVPGLVVGFIIAQFSMFLIRGGLEISGQITRGIVGTGISQNTNNNAFQGFINAFSGFPQSYNSIVGDCINSQTPMVAEVNGQCNPVQSSADVLKTLKLALVTVAAGIGAVLLYIVAFLLLIRRFVFFALAPIAPIAIFGYFFPPLRAIWTRWWKNLWSWLLMPIVIGFWIWMALVWFSSSFPPSPSSGGAGGIASIFGYAFGIVCLYMATRTPFTFAADAKLAVDKWNSFGKENIGRPLKEAAIKYTPAGAAIRGYKNRKTIKEEKSKALLEGATFKSRMSRFLGGDIVNRQEAKAKLKQEQAKNDQAKMDSDVQSGALKILSQGYFKTWANRINKSADLPLIGRAIGRVGSAFDSLGESASRVTEAMERVLGVVGLGNMAKSLTYAGRDELMRQSEMDAQQSANIANAALEQKFYNGRGNARIARSRQDQLIDNLATTAMKEDAKQDQEGKAAQEELYNWNAAHSTDPDLTPPSTNTHVGQRYRASNNKFEGYIRKKIGDKRGSANTTIPPSRIGTYRKVATGGALDSSDQPNVNRALIDTLYAHDRIGSSRSLEKIQDGADFLLQMFPSDPTLVNIRGLPNNASRDDVYTAVNAYGKSALGVRLSALEAEPRKALK